MEEKDHSEIAEVKIEASCSDIISDTKRFITSFFHYSAHTFSPPVRTSTGEGFPLKVSGAFFYQLMYFSVNFYYRK